MELDVADSGSPFMQIFGSHGMEEMEVNLRDMLGQLPGFKGKTKRRRARLHSQMWTTLPILPLPLAG